MALIVLWLAGVSLGAYGFLVYKATPGQASQPPVYWPENTSLRHPGGNVLVMVLHPLCPCSRASVTELARLLSAQPQRPRTYVLFRDVEAGGAGAGRAQNLEKLALWGRVRAIPGTVLVADRGGRVAQSFGASTSGDVIAYDRFGRLLFHGGLTESRGHEGKSFGGERLRALLTGATADKPESPVFGCALNDEHTGKGLKAVLLSAF